MILDVKFVIKICSIILKGTLMFLLDAQEDIFLSIYQPTYKV